MSHAPNTTGVDFRYNTELKRKKEQKKQSNSNTITLVLVCFIEKGLITLIRPQKKSW
jgi:hypothetical protein